jgi:2-polyprenyl-3-methyl-5-hydroxy-6-metoxy-1,4-benzoquinol methylase
MDSEDVKQTVKWDSEKLRKFWEFEYKVRQWQFFSGVYTKPVTRKIRKLIGKNRQRILDLGCGNGDMVRSLAEYYPSVSGADIQSSRLEELNTQSKSVPRIQFYSYDELSEMDKSFDVITSIEIIEHLNDDELDTHFDQIKKLLKPDGIVFISVPNSENLERSFVRCPDCGAVFHKVQHMQSWTPKRLTSYLQMEGFEIISIGTTNFGLELHFDIWRSFVIQILRLMKRKMPNLYVTAKLTS